MRKDTKYLFDKQVLPVFGQYSPTHDHADSPSVASERDGGGWLLKVGGQTNAHVLEKLALNTRLMKT